VRYSTWVLGARKDDRLLLPVEHAVQQDEERGDLVAAAHLEKLDAEGLGELGLKVQANQRRLVQLCACEVGEDGGHRG